MGQRYCTCRIEGVGGILPTQDSTISVRFVSLLVYWRSSHTHGARAQKGDFQAHFDRLMKLLKQLTKYVEDGSGIEAPDNHTDWEEYKERTLDNDVDKEQFISWNDWSAVYETLSIQRTDFEVAAENKVLEATKRVAAANRRVRGVSV